MRNVNPTILLFTIVKLRDEMWMEVSIIAFDLNTFIYI